MAGRESGLVVAENNISKVKSRKERKRNGGTRRFNKFKKLHTENRGGRKKEDTQSKTERSVSHFIAENLLQKIRKKGKKHRWCNNNNKRDKEREKKDNEYSLH